MATKEIKVTIVGVTPLLQHRFGDAEMEALDDTTRSAIRIERGTPREEAEKVCYRDKEGYLFHPGAAIARLLREAGSAHKLKGTRKSVKFIVPSAVIVLDDAIPLTNGSPAKRLKTFEVDSRPVTIPATKGRVMRHRPRQDEWSATFRLRVNEKLLPAEFVHKLLVEGGEQLGIGDFRPEKGGPFGTFRVTEFKE